MYDKCYFCLDQLPKLKKESTASFFVNFGGAGVQKSRPTLLYNHENHENDDGDDVISYHMSHRRCQVHKSLMPGKYAKVPTCH